jgi:hypothetical protein
LKELTDAKQRENSAKDLTETTGPINISIKNV